ncbi:MBL fold metallo-hydrolase [Brevibacillus laterosporus]|uniref:MBL fold metallo-hydrolase n=1 Tax=Brevibacillus laterosporus TaxID=1465 RepID=UPI0003B1CB67|nr:MBL fold metallo-hydrolase [Brevibacillus laterosporus]ERM19963.1 hydrolase [Brevibacillus laterosporus PE36]
MNKFQILSIGISIALFATACSNNAGTNQGVGRNQTTQNKKIVNPHSNVRQMSKGATKATTIKEAPSTVNARYVEPSAKKVLHSGEKINRLYNRNLNDKYILQRLTSRTYWVQSNFYSTTFFVGKKGVLLFDPLEDRTDQLLAAVRKVTKLPITSVVYSHDHADHIGDASKMLAALKKSGAKPRIIASKATFDKQVYLKSKLPRPTEVISWPQGAFKFEDLTVQLHGFQRAGHSDDHSVWLLKDEGVLHAPDLINPDQPPFWRFAGSDTFLYHEQNLQDARKLPWKWVNGGHGNVGEKKDFDFDLAFIKDLKKAVGDAIQTQKFGDFVDPKKGAHSAFLPAWLNAVSKQATDTLRPKYGKYYGFEYSTPPNAEMVAEWMFSYR